MDNEEKKEEKETVEQVPEIKEEAPVSQESEPQTQPQAESQEPAETQADQEAQEVQEEESSVLESSTGEIFDEKSEYHWYFVQVLSGHEDKVTKILKEVIKARSAENEILNVIVPKVEKPERTKSGEKKMVLKKLYPGYILLRMKMSDENWNLIRNTNNIIDFVGGKYNPSPISRQEWEEIFMGKKKARKEEFKVKFNINEKIKIIEGAFANFYGDIAEINEEKKHVKVMISIFGRLTPVELSFEDIEKI